ncbi:MULTISPECIES: flagellar motor switch protein FliM [Sphingomonas]|jgi:flagellar motor switch protein FliM|uniref:Flagellar motor switch protein FliM n=1 Tax=Sphingomonas leidyi TaxID=68569 RepID=A0A7X5ZWV2_9SPHN|nr:MULTISPECIES: flagellar motor switch protein FliM [Sphingomonas]MBN8811277.1 flagellar motor switch protein FliM [Sphingomonas sp.]NIJ66582.1 flagellar motor switch protein FliM [Sphingomonas leidyi]OJY54732.1 MAG: flagellar motor switch protein FliM [Sphingomonas sp. 67-41]
MIDLEDFDLPDPPAPPGEMGGGVFDQADIDALFGDVGPIARKSGLRAVIESKVISHERLPMLEVVCDRVVRSFASSMRNLTSDGVDVSLEEVTSTRFGEFMNRVALPAMVGVFKIEEWESYGLVTVDSNLIYSVVDALLGGRGGGGSPMVIDGRAFTTIETGLVSRMLTLALDDFSEAFAPIEPVNMNLERIETNPRFAAIAGVSNICATATFRVDMDGRGGRFTLVFPYATLEPVRDKLLQRFMGEKSGRDSIWEAHMAAEVRKTNVSMSVLLGEKAMSIADLRNLEIGQTIALHKSPDDALDVACGGVKLAQGQIGQRNGQVAVRLINDVSSDKKVKQ